MSDKFRSLNETNSIKNNWTRFSTYFMVGEIGSYTLNKVYDPAIADISRGESITLSLGAAALTTAFYDKYIRTQYPE